MCQLVSAGVCVHISPFGYVYVINDSDVPSRNTIPLAALPVDVTCFFLILWIAISTARTQYPCFEVHGRPFETVQKSALEFIFLIILRAIRYVASLLSLLHWRIRRDIAIRPSLRRRIRHSKTKSSTPHLVELI